MSKDVLWFSQTRKEDIPLVGGKAANLGELKSAGLPVPDGFTVTASAFFDFLDEEKLKPKIKSLLEKVDVNNTDLLTEASDLITSVIKKAPIPASLATEIAKSYKKLFNGGDGLVAVRSSATAEDLPNASFAGQQETFLNVLGERELLEAVRNCWASLYKPRAIFYREQNGFDHFKVGLAAVVQKMVQSEVSGVMFTIDPIKNDKRKIVIESVWGLGELIVQGIVTPDHYEVDKNGFKLIRKQMSDQAKQLIKVGRQTKEIDVAKQYRNIQKLSDEKIRELAKIGKKIEDHYGFPQDIEWTLMNDKLEIVQSRPVTTIKEVDKTKEHIEINLPVILRGSPASPGIAIGFPKVIYGVGELGKIKQGDILVAPMTNPDYVPAMKRSAAIVTDKGGRTSHAAIVSRELGIPCVVGTEKATKMLRQKHSVLTVNGANGIVYKGALATDKLATIEYVEKQKEEQVKLMKTATKVFVNLGQKELAEDVAKKYVDGIGLLRAEFMIAEIGTHPRKIIAEKKQKVFIEKLAASIVVFAEAFDPRPIIYRTTDFKSNEYKNLKGGEKYEDTEENPLIGYRGAYRYLADSQVFEMELEAIKQVRNKYGFINLWLMIPFVRTLSEMEAVKKLVVAAGLHRSPSFKLLMMAEIPSNVILVDKFLDLGIDGVSIGSNDLTMLLLGLDRDNAKVSSEFNELDEAVLWSIEHIIKECRKRKLYSGICGQGPSVYPELTEKLIEWGISSVSVSPDAIDKTREIVYEAEKKLVSKK